MAIDMDFFEKTKYPYLSKPAQQNGIPQPPLEQPIPSDAKIISLPDPKSITVPALDIRKAIEQRSTLRKYSEIELNLEEFSYLLWVTQGIRSISDRPVTFRNVPSAGSRHAFETYILINRVGTLAPGLYRYSAIKHCIYLTNNEVGINEKITTACKEQGHVRTSAATFFWVADINRMAWRYSERAWRYVLLDAGHVCQNLYLAAESIHCGVCGIAAYDDDLLNAALGVNGKDELVVYAATIGKR
ncbi:SagB/ThcOx family dehydrogenase [Leptolinea tardivitalis]|uniref:Nitroreductase n=1 Tax=Leptolinea tardivitalis TaxID=229920 RepID=A0A0P6WWL3_9CHLR|nr:SagB/ThcOx family dehydrogenase [Leptolinea tardivitalis]KPL73230.1 nitroreductase [Leptolinea tardivitalis]GAP21342.1 protein containing SagB-type dehydrogenase domain [Leptolinea tardivitalis]